MSSIYEWADRALALPGAPDIWLRAADGKGLITVDGDEGLYGIASDGTWWEPTGRADRPWVLAVDHPATEGVLLRRLGDHLVMAGPKSVLAGPPSDPRLTPMSNQARCHNHGDSTLGRAVIKAAEKVGKWPGGITGGWGGLSTSPPEMVTAADKEAERIRSGGGRAAIAAAAALGRWPGGDL